MNSINNYVKIIMIVSIVLYSSLAYTQRSAPDKPPDSIAQATMAAQIDARSDVSSALWLGAGCLFSIFAVGAAYLIMPGPRAGRLMGKSPDYVFIYSEVYRSTAHNRQLKYASIGCGIATIMYITSIIVNQYIER